MSLSSDVKESVITKPRKNIVMMIMLCAMLCWSMTRRATAQFHDADSSITTEEFLQSLDPTRLTRSSASHSYSRSALPSHTPHQVEAAVHAEDTESRPSSTPNISVVRASFDSTNPQAALNSIPQFNPSPDPIATPMPVRTQSEQGMPYVNVPNASPTGPPLNTELGVLSESTAHTPAAKDDHWSWGSWKFDPANPRFLVEAQILSFRRSNDAGGTVSTSRGFERNGRDLAGRYIFSMLNGTVDRTEWIFTGPFEWERNIAYTGPSGTNLDHGSLPPNSLGTVNDSAQHTQLHTSRLSSLEWNRSWSGDGMSSIAGGFKLWDYDERYVLQASQSSATGEFRKSTDNLLAGAHMRLVLSRPMSQRLSIAISSDVGWYANFANGSYTLLDGTNSLATDDADRFRMTWVIQPTAGMLYRLTQNSTAYCGYEAVYFTGLATVSELQTGNIAVSTPLSVRAKDDQLFYGWTAGIQARF